MKAREISKQALTNYYKQDVLKKSYYGVYRVSSEAS